jgi:hypothetical protein
LLEDASHVAAKGEKVVAREGGKVARLPSQSQFFGLKSLRCLLSGHGRFLPGEVKA